MNTKLIITAVLAVTLGVSAGWLVPHALQARQTATVTDATPVTATASAPTAAVESTPATATTVASTDSKILYYICPMHPTIHYDHAGDCPICGMKLKPVYASDTNTPAATPSCCSSGGCTR